MLLLADRDEDRGLKQSQLISYALIKMSDTGLYGKPIERWNARDLRDRRQWSQFRQFMVEQYERMLREAGGTTMDQDGYGSAFNAQEQDDDSLVTAGTSFAERASENEKAMGSVVAEIGELKAAFAAMMSSGAPPPTHVYAPTPPQPPQAAYFGQGEPA